MRLRGWLRFLGFVGLIWWAAVCLAANGSLAEAHAQFEQGRYEQAVATLRAALDRDSQNAALHYWLARCYFELGDFDGAIAGAERSVALAPLNSEYQLWLGRAYGRKAERAGWFSGFSLARKTRRAFEQAVRLDPKNVLAQRDLIEFYYSAPGIVGGGDDKARRQIAALEALDPVEAHLAWADFWKDKKKPERVEAELREALAARPRRVEGYFQAADFYIARNDAARAEGALEAAARANAADGRLSYYRGVARVLAGNRLAEAERLLKTYMTGMPRRSDLPSHAVAHEWLGRLYELQGQPRAAAEQYSAAVRLDPGRKSAREALARLPKTP